MYRCSTLLLSVAPVLAWAGSAGAQVAGQGKVLFEYWDGIGGTLVSDLTSHANYPNNPTSAEWRDNFQSKSGRADNYGIRARAFLRPPQTGEYTFWVAGDDYCQLWLSMNENPANVMMIAQVPGWTNVAQWTKYPKQKSAPVTLQAGKEYYLEGLMKEGDGGDSLDVGWAGPGIGAATRVIAGQYLRAFIRNPEPLFMASNPSPADGAVDVTQPLFKWTPGMNATLHDIYFGTDPKLGAAEYRGPTPMAMYFHPEPLVPGQTYYWRIDEIEATGIRWTGKVWSFTVKPLEAHFPDPADGAENAGVTPRLKWMAGQDAVSHIVYFGADQALVKAGDALVKVAEQTETTFDLRGLSMSRTYYWRVDERDATGKVVPGPVWSFSTIGAVTGKIVRQWWMNIEGTAVSDLTSDPRYPTRPDGTELIDLFEGHTDWADNYGTRLYGWLKPPRTGDYTFWVAGDETQELWLSTDADPANAVLIARVPGWTKSREWTKYPEQKSQPIPLRAGQKYYIEALGKEGTGSDSMAVSWQPPGGAQEVIPGPFVDTYGPPSVTVFNSYPANGALDIAQQGLMLSWPPVQGARYTLYWGYDPAALVVVAQGLDVTTYEFPLLEWGQNFYWRVDLEQPDGTIIAGPVWGFRTADFLPVDDFERYIIPGEEIAGTWVPVGPVTNVFAEQTIVYSGTLSMALAYRNVALGESSEAQRTFAGLQDWTLNDGDTLSLRVRGDEDNDPQRLYVRLTDAEGRSQTVEYPDRNIVRATKWVEWLIPLSAFSPVNVGAVRTMTLGVDNLAPAVPIPIPIPIPVGTSIENPPGTQTFSASSAQDGAGTIYIDCIRIIRFGGAVETNVRFSGHVYETGTEKGIPDPNVVFTAGDISVGNTHPSPETGQYRIDVPHDKTYTANVSAQGYKKGSFTVYISPTDADRKVEIRISDLQSVECEEFDSGVAGCGLNGLNIYLTPNDN